jgi:hypothetical protein
LSTEIGGGYAEWVSWLNDFSRDIDRPMPLILLGEGSGAETMHRFANRCHAALQTRHTLWSTRYARELGHVITRRSPAAEQELKRCVVHARRRLQPIFEFLDSPTVTKEIREPLKEGFVAALKKTHDEQLADARSQGPAGEFQMRVFSEVRLFDPAPARIRSQPAGPTNTVATGRRLIIGNGGNT